MPRTTATAYKATDPKIVSDWLDQRDADHKQFKADASAFAAQYGRKSLVQRTNGLGDSYTVFAIGLDPDGFADVPEGWRVDSKTGYIVPAKRTPEGKAAAAELSKIQYTSCAPEMPHFVHSVSDPQTGGGFFGGFSVEKVGQDYYATIGFELDESSKKAAESDLWEPVRLSAYWAAVEEAEQES